MGYPGVRVLIGPLSFGWMEGPRSQKSRSGAPGTRLCEARQISPPEQERKLLRALSLDSMQKGDLLALAGFDRTAADSIVARRRSGDEMSATIHGAQPLAKLDQWDDSSKVATKKGSLKRSSAFDATATPGVAEFYRLNHEGQIVEYVLGKEKEYFSLNKGMKSIWEAAEFLNTLVDDSDPTRTLPRSSIFCRHRRRSDAMVIRDGWY